MKRKRPSKRDSAKRAASDIGPDEGANGNGSARHELALDSFRLIVIGASAGGVEALRRIVGDFPPTLPAAVFVVLHISASGPSLLPDILGRAGYLPASHAEEGMAIEPGNIYIAPPDHHLLIKRGRMTITRGPRENSARPSVDPLFRTAARQYGPWVIGVILSGGLDDGTLGLMDIKRFGGMAVVQDPQDAMFPSMPTSAVENVATDAVLPLDDIGEYLTHLARQPVSLEEGAAFMSASTDAEGPDVAEVGNDDLKTRNMDGPPSKFTCPECGGALWELENGKVLRYRCHIGHGYTAESLMAAQTSRLEDALWSALRALEETAGMRRRMADRAKRGGWDIMASSYQDQAHQAEVRAGLIRSVLVRGNPKHITKDSATAIQDKAERAVDPTVGKAAKKAGKPLSAGTSRPRRKSETGKRSRKT